MRDRRPKAILQKALESADRHLVMLDRAALRSFDLAMLSDGARMAELRQRQENVQALFLAAGRYKAIKEQLGSLG